MQELMIKIAMDLNSKLAMLNQKVTPRIASEIEDHMKQNSATGKAFGSDRYDNTYQGAGVPLKSGKSQNSGYARTRELAGLPTSPVVLRFKANRIENTKVETTGSGSTISFVDSEAGQIFKYHHDGINYKNVGQRVRSVFPKQDSSVPQSIRDLANRLIMEVLSGR
jgi:hypothetical protein